MTQEELLAKFDQFAANIRKIIASKNKDYAGNDDAFANFRACELLDLCTTETGILVRKGDKYKRLVSFFKNNEYDFKEETLEDTCMDDAAYAFLLWVYHCDKSESLRSEGVS